MHCAIAAVSQALCGGSDWGYNTVYPCRPPLTYNPRKDVTADQDKINRVDTDCENRDLSAVITSPLSVKNTLKNRALRKDLKALFQPQASKC